MAVPAFQAFFLPLLQVLADAREHRFGDLHHLIADRMALTEEDRSELLPSGKQRRYANRAGWAKTYLAKAGLLETPRRGVVRLTERGRQALASGNVIDLDFLDRFQEFQLFRAGLNGDGDDVVGKRPDSVADGEAATKTPGERLEDLVRSMTRELAVEILDHLRAKDSAFFEHVVVQLLVKMGYGGSIEDAGKAVGRSGDDGIDGIIKQDRLGLDNVYVQAKRYGADRTVGAGDVRNLAGALQMRKATKGVLITTSAFTRDAFDTARQIGTIVLVDGQQLAELMIEYDLGVATEVTYAVKKIDQDFFDDWA